MKATDRTLTELVRPGPAVPLEVETVCRGCGERVLMRVHIGPSRRFAATITDRCQILDRTEECPHCGRERHTPVEAPAE